MLDVYAANITVVKCEAKTDRTESKSRYTIIVGYPKPSLHS